MSYDVNFECYDAWRAWFAVKGRDLTRGFDFVAQAVLRDRQTRELSALTKDLAEDSLVLRATASRGEDDPVRSYLFLDEGHAALAVEPSYGSTVSVLAAARSQARAEQLLARVAELLPHREPPPEEVVRFRFWRKTQCGADYKDRELRCPKLESLAGNYAREQFQRLEALAALQRPASQGKVILWHGPPGTGKTYAVRALARAWKQSISAQAEVILDPDELFARADYLHDVLLNEAADDWEDDDDDDGELKPKRAAGRLRLIVIEDSASLFADDCRSTPGFARLLNLSDGIIGQGLQVVFLLTANEAIERIDPAITRYGRCLAVHEFGPLPTDEARRWLTQRSGDADRVAGPTTLAGLYELLQTR